MEILVLNGSPKGKNSVTLQTALYFEKRYGKHKFTYYNAAQKIRALEKDFSPLVPLLEKADMVLFVYPVYTLLLPYQLQRFLERMHEENLSLEGKIVSQITTSKHFFDTTAHKYLEETVLDLGGNYIAGLSADMEDLLEEKGRIQAECWFEKLLFDISITRYTKGCLKRPTLGNKSPFQTTGTAISKNGKKNVVIVTNALEEDANLLAMIEEFVAQCPHPVTVKNIRTFPFQGGCTGCLQCSVSGDCMYHDDFPDYLRKQIQSADGIIYAFTVFQHYTHSSFKCFDDRQFVNGHRAVTHGKCVGYLIAGKYSEESNLQTLVEARCEVSKMYYAGLATDEGDTAEDIRKFALSMDYALTHAMSKPYNFYGVGGSKIFRDLVYLMQGMMKEDHKFYKEQGYYDFPHNQKLKMMQMKFVGFLMSLPDAQKKMKGSMSHYILMPYTKLLEQTKPKDGSI